MEKCGTVVSHNHFSKEIKSAIYKGALLPTTLYENENWGCQQKIKCKLDNVILRKLV